MSAFDTAPVTVVLNRRVEVVSHRTATSGWSVPDACAIDAVLPPAEREGTGRPQSSGPSTLERHTRETSHAVATPGARRYRPGAGCSVRQGPSMR